VILGVDEEAAIRRLNDVFRVDAAPQLRAHATSRERNQSFDIPVKRDCRGSAVAGLDLPQQFH
jgi:hypothetical protein